VRCTAFASVQGKILAHDPDRHRALREKLMSAIDRLPESAQKLTRQRLRPGGDKIVDANYCRHKMTLLSLMECLVNEGIYAESMNDILYASSFCLHDEAPSAAKPEPK
jgi:hypothetical protein